MEDLFIIVLATFEEIGAVTVIILIIIVVAIYCGYRCLRSKEEEYRERDNY